MSYTIKQAAEIMNATPTPLHYYDKLGLLPFIERKESGCRFFPEEDIAMLRVIKCLKKSGMPIKDILQFLKRVQRGDDSLRERYEMFLERKRTVEAQMAPQIHIEEGITNLPCEP